MPIIAGSSWGTDVAVEGYESGPDIDDNARYNEIGPGYFRTLGISLLAGRDFDRSDAIGAPNDAAMKKWIPFRVDGHKRVGPISAARGASEIGN